MTGQDGPLRIATARGKAALAASILGSGMAFLDSTAVNVALPAMGSNLETGFAGFQWVVNAYLLALGALVLVGGALGDLYGKRRVFILGNLAFAAASLMCGLASNVQWLVFFRLLQGMGAALLVPASLAILRSVFHSEEQGRAVGLWSGLTGLAVLAGPVLGGWLVDAFSWRYVFFINPVLAVPVIALARRALPESRESQARRPDWPGAAAAITGLGGLSYALIQGPEIGWDRPPVRAALLLGIAALAAFIAVERRSPHPMFPLKFLRRRRFAAANGVTVFVYFVISGVFFLLVITLQQVYGYSALQAGAAQAPVTLLLLALSPRTGQYASEKGPRLPMTAGPLCAAAGTAFLSRVADYQSFALDVLPGILLFGIGLGFTVAPLTTTALSALEKEHSGLASGVNNGVARIAQLLAIPVLPLLAGLSGLDRLSGEAFAQGFGRAMWIGAGLLAFAGILAWFALGREPEK